MRAESRGGVDAPGANAGDEMVGAIAGVLAEVDPGAGGSPSASSGPFGNLTLQKAHAIGHAVWLQLREQGAKVLCNELIHERRALYKKPDMTYFGGDATRWIWLEKIDREPVEEEDEKTATANAGGSASGSGTLAQGKGSAKPPRQGKITGVTQVMTMDATLYDMGGGGLDFSDIVARGPGRLESRPDLKEPVERIAIWQDEMTIQNILGPNSQLVRKMITLTGTRPSFVDTVKEASIDSAERIHRLAQAEACDESEGDGPCQRTHRRRGSRSGDGALAVGLGPACRRHGPIRRTEDKRRHGGWGPPDGAAPGVPRRPLPRTRQEDGGAR